MQHQDGALNAGGDYETSRRRSLLSPAEFWGTESLRIDWMKEPTRVFVDPAGDSIYQWFPDGVLNTCDNALDRHVRAGRGNDQALIYDSPIAGVTEYYTYAELTVAVAKFAGVLTQLGVGIGDRVLLYFPMIPQAVIAMLACARIGAVHAVVFGGFGARELALRIDDATPKVVLAASCGIEPGRVVEYMSLLNEALELADHAPDQTVIFQREMLKVKLRSGMLDWEAVMATAEPVGCVALSATDPLYILYTSGTTGKPKGIVRDNGGHAVAMHWSTTQVFGIDAGDVFFAASDIGWVVGHSYIVYGPLLVGATTILYEGKPVGTPDAAAFWRMVEEHRVNAILTAPTAARAIRRDDPDGHHISAHDLSSLRGVFLAGEKLDPDTYRWLSAMLDAPIVDNWWQTETGWPVASNLMGLDPVQTKVGSSTRPVPGFDVQILDDYGTRIADGKAGAICIALPLPPGTLFTVWNDEERFRDGYLTDNPGYYTTGDAGRIDEDGYLYVLGRTDDVMNVAGHRLSSAQIEAAVSEHPGVAECAVIGAFDPLKGQVPRAVLVLMPQFEDRESEVVAEVRARVRREVGPIATLAAVDVVEALPKTRSGKIVRRALRQIAAGDVPDIPPTIENPAAIENIRRVLRPLGNQNNDER